jgi:hypothetical protein
MPVDFNVIRHIAFHFKTEAQWYQRDNCNSIKKLELLPNLGLIEVIVGKNWEDRTLCRNEAWGKCLEHLGEVIEMGLSRTSLNNVLIIPLPHQHNRVRGTEYLTPQKLKMEVWQVWGVGRQEIPNYCSHITKMYDDFIFGTITIVQKM